MATYHDLFVSYAPDNNKEREPWVDELIEAIKHEYNQQTGRKLDVVVDKSLRVGTRKEEILTELNTSRCLLAVMSPSYFNSSDECREQWEHFRSVEKQRGVHDLILPVYHITCDRFDTAGPGADEWLKDLAARTPEDFRQYRSSGPGGFRDVPLLKKKVDHLVEGLRKALERFEQVSINPSVLDVKVLERLRSLALLSVLALRLDRFKDGGWGLSWRNWFTRSSDSIFYRTGLPEVNLLVLRGLRMVLGGRLLIDEMKGSFPPVSSTTAPVEDRKVQFAYFLSLLQNYVERKPDVFIAREIAYRTIDTGEKLKQRPFVRRWSLSTKSEPAVREVCVLLYDLIARIHNDDDTFSRLTEQDLTKPHLKEYLDDAERFVVEWIRDNWLFSLLAQNGPAVGSGTGGEESDEVWILCFLNYRVLASLNKTAVRVAVSRNDLTEPCKEIEKTLGKLCSPENPFQLGRAILYYSLYLAILRDLESNTGNVPDDHITKIERDWSTLLMRPEVGEATLQGNCVLWAVLLLLAEQYEVSPGVSKSEEVWKLGGRVQDERRSTIIRQLQNIESRKEKIELSGFYDKQYGQIKESCGEIIENLRDFKKVFQSAMFWGFKDPDLRAKDVKPGDVGYLEVDLKTNQIAYANEVYNRMFLVPFGILTGIAIYDLERLIREFGSGDARLVELIGQTVVKCVYTFPTAPHTEFNELNFQQRTKNIISHFEKVEEALGNDDSPEPRTKTSEEHEVLDVLELRTGGMKERYVLRSVCLRSAPLIFAEERREQEVSLDEQRDRRGGSQEQQQDKIICWQFVEFTSEMNALRENIRSSG